jgi:predicted nuclease of predicted toxin-antitoxin system
MVILADENFHGDAVYALRERGHDVVWVLELSAGISDEEVLALAQREKRMLVTFDKDFGELAFRKRLPASSGIILFRVTPRNPAHVVNIVISSLESQPNWDGLFGVVTDTRIRVVLLPNQSL